MINTSFRNNTMIRILARYLTFKQNLNTHYFNNKISP
jgi:hypothetical protein